MKIYVVAQTAKQTTTYLLEGAYVRGPVTAIKIGEAHRWHDKVEFNVDMRKYLGEIWSVFTMCLSNNCQAHIKKFDEIIKLDDNDMLILSWSFCAQVSPVELPKRKEVYIIAW